MTVTIEILFRGRDIFLHGKQRRVAPLYLRSFLIVCCMCRTPAITLAGKGSCQEKTKAEGVKEVTFISQR